MGRYRRMSLIEREELSRMLAAGRTEHKGQTYYFCGSKCQEMFALNPEQYMGTSAGTPKSDQSCCS